MREKLSKVCAFSGTQGSQGSQGSQIDLIYLINILFDIYYGNKCIII